MKLKLILLFGIVALAVGWGVKVLITPAPVEHYVLPPKKPIKPIELGPPPKDLLPVEAAIYRTQVSEELIRVVSPKLREIASIFESGETDLNSSGLFKDSVLHTGLADNVEANANPDALFSKQKHDVADAASEMQSSDVLSSLRNQFQLSKTQFGVLGSKLSDDGNEFETLTSYEGRIEGGGTGCGGFKAKQKIVWERQEGNWLISQWHQIALKTIVADTPIFADVTESAIPDAATLEAVRKSAHMELMLKEAAGETYPQRDEKAFQYFNDWHSSAVYPSVNVVDFDGDGLDDLFLTDQWLAPVMMRNEGNGTFVDVTDSVGLMMDDPRINCALFADFDNDGDADAFIGRVSKPSLYFENADGKFSEVKEVAEDLADCRYVNSAAAIDVNRDGLLDLYLSTYCSYGSPSPDWVEYAVGPKLREKLWSHVYGHHSFVDRGGPPNVLLINDSGLLCRADVSDEVEQWRNSFQPLWFDYDDDGDEDLYVCNDFSPDALLRNDTPQGSSSIAFTEVTREVFGERCMAFGMGASVGDYDSDGDLDLYVSNMYSKAGNRIFEQIGDGYSEQLKIAAAGNFLFRKEGSKYEQVAGMGDSEQHVSKVGWSFGGQFADFDNDGQLDLYVPSGLFTAPKSIKRDDDL